ncbi:MAG: choice-of-anchor J domain-containing protein [Paludibacteraceae bacterium]|nr:choice-of-anchor J domain-containing protein [Paludibacteraceae bacterium]
MKKHFLLLTACMMMAVTALAEPITVAEALAIGKNLEHNTTTTETYTIVGYVNVITENSFNESFNNMTFWIADTKGTASSSNSGALQVYRGRPDQELQEGDKISIDAKLKKWYSTVETDPTNAPVTLLERGGQDDPQDNPQTQTGSLRVCAQNLENYYYNLNTGRGNYTQAEFVAKTRKIVDMMLSVDADIYAFCEVEAQPVVLAQLADSANARVSGTPYSAVSDGISVEWSEEYDNNLKSGFIYRTDRVRPIGSNTGATSGNGYYNHTMRIQAFEQLSNSGRLVLSMNHFKAKTGGGDQGEAQRQTNATNLVNALRNVVIDDDILILGDLNCEYGEEPITIITSAGYEEQLLKYNANAYSHCYNGGELIDHALANQTMAGQIVNAYVKHICTYKCTDGVYSTTSYSDHDPYIVEINLTENGGSGSQDDDECKDINETYLAEGGTDLGKMTTDNTDVWRYDTSREGYAKGSKQGGATGWLMTPSLNLSQMQSVSLQFQHAHKFAGTPSEELTLWVTPSFSTAETSEWHQLTIPNYGTNNDWTFVSNTINVPQQYLGKKTVFGFKYVSTTDKYATWEIKNLKVTGSCNGTEAVENVQQSETPVRKVLINGQLYLMYEGQMYDVRGNRVQ